MCPPTQTSTDHYFKYLWHDPLDLDPLTPPCPSKRSRRVVRTRRKDQQNLAFQPVLERLSGESGDAYTLDHAIVRQPGGVTIFLAQKVRKHTKQDDDKEDCLPFFVPCGSAPVIVKAAPRPLVTSTNSMAKKIHCDNPFKEIAALQLLMQHHPRHPNVIPLLDCMQDPDFIYLVLPYLPGGDLFSRVETTQGKGLPAAEAATYLRQMAEGLLFMKQTSGLAHHDVSLENVMLTSEGVAQIIDLGMCLRVPKVAKGPKTTTAEQPVYLTPQSSRGKPSYVAPEVVREEACDPFAADVWSLGVSLYAMLTARPLYNSPHDQSFKMLARGMVEDVVVAYEGYGLVLPSLAKDLVCRMLDADPSKRPTLEEVLTHPFLVQSQQQQEEQAVAVSVCTNKENSECNNSNNPPITTTTNVRAFGFFISFLTGTIPAFQIWQKGGPSPPPSPSSSIADTDGSE